MRTRTFFMLAITTLLLAAAGRAAEPPGPGLQIAGALAAAPEDRREGAAVLGYSPAGELVTLREGTNEIVCLADRPGDERFHVACYHRSLEPFMRRGRELRGEGVESAESYRIRHEEADAGKLEMPKAPAALYNLGGPSSIFDPATGEVHGGNWVWVVYTPWATEEGTGLPTTPMAPGAPWIMRPGTASSHIMIVEPREAEPEAKPDAGP